MQLKVRSSLLMARTLTMIDLMRSLRMEMRKLRQELKARRSKSKSLLATGRASRKIGRQ